MKQLLGCTSPRRVPTVALQHCIFTLNHTGSFPGCALLLFHIPSLLFRFCLPSCNSLPVCVAPEDTEALVRLTLSPSFCFSLDRCCLAHLSLSARRENISKTVER